MNKKADRARQFAPFAALTGYYGIINERNKIEEHRRERSEEENEALSKKVTAIKKGSMVRLNVYCNKSYETVEGMVAEIDFIYRYVKIVKRKICLDDIYDVDFIDF